jgi:hypothetical protein
VVYDQLVDTGYGMIYKGRTVIEEEEETQAPSSKKRNL